MKYIIVLSGKGGVGKSTITTNLAIALSKEYKVGLNDIDILCPNIPMMLGIKEKLTAKNKIIPIDYDGLKVVSLGLIPILDDDQFHAWRGDTMTMMIKECLTGTEWGELDYMVLDLPPGTGDETLTVLTELKDNTLGAVVVAEPTKVAIADAKKAINLLLHLKIPIIGVVYNKVGEVYGDNAEEPLDIPTIGKIPLNPKIRIAGDSGKPTLWKTSRFKKIVEKIEETWEAKQC